jgi:hypothetical protein
MARLEIQPSPLRDRVGYSDRDRFRGYVPVHCHSGLQPFCLRFAAAVTGRHARLDTRLLARLYRGRHLRRLSSTHLQGATLHGSGRAAFPHPAVASGDDAKAAQGIGMTHAGGRQPLVDEPIHPGPQDPAVLATTRQGAMPEMADLEPEEAQRGAVHGHAVLSDVPTHDRVQPLALLRDGIVPASSKLGFDLAQLGLQPFADGLPQHREAPVASLLRADVRESEKRERLGLALTAPTPVVGREGSELDEAGFVGMQFEFELSEALLKFSLEPLGIHLAVEAQHDVIGEPDDDDVAVGPLLSPCLDPEIERMESRPKELHLRPLAERCGSLSAHTAPIRQTRRCLRSASGRTKTGSALQFDA